MSVIKHRHRPQWRENDMEAAKCPLCVRGHATRISRNNCPTTNNSVTRSGQLFNFPSFVIHLDWQLIKLIPKMTGRYTVRKKKIWMKKKSQQQLVISEMFQRKKTKQVKESKQNLPHLITPRSVTAVWLGQLARSSFPSASLRVEKKNI